MCSSHSLGRGNLCVVFLLAVAALFATAGPAAAGRSAQTFAYITNTGSGSVSVIDTSDYSNDNPVVQTTLPLWPSGGTSPFGVGVPPVINRDNLYEPHRAYVSNRDRDGTMSVIESIPGPNPVYDPWSHRVVATVAVPGCSFPRGIAAHPDGTRVFLACSDANVVVMSTISLTWMANIPLYGEPKASLPYGIHVTPGGKKVYVTDQVQSNLIVINANNYSVTERKDLPRGSDGHNLLPEGVHVDPRGRTVWVAYSGSHPGDIGVSVYRVSDESLVGHVRFDDDAQPASVYARSRRVGYVTLYGSGELAEVRVYPSSTRIRRTPVGSSPQGLTADRYRNVYVANNGGHSVTAVFDIFRGVSSTLGVGQSPTAFGEFMAPRKCSSCTM